MNKTAVLPSSEIIQQKINDYLEKNKLIFVKAKNGNVNNPSNKIVEVKKYQKDKNKINNIKGNLNKNIKKRNIENKENINLNTQKTQKINKSIHKPNFFIILKRKTSFIRFIIKKV